MKIALSGYYGFDNAGDEALLSAITFSIKQIEPGVDFVVFSGSPHRTASSHQIRAVHYLNPLQIIRELKSSDLLISGGGSIFQDVTSIRSLLYYISVVALAKILGKPVIFYAQGVGPINHKISKFMMRLVANRVDLITLRDHDSVVYLKSLGITRPPVKITADPVFSLQPGLQEKKSMQKLLSDHGCGGTSIIGVSIRPWPDLDGYQPILARVLDYLAVQGYTVVFIPLSYPEDLHESRKVISLMKKRPLLLDRKFTSQEFLALISNFKMIIGMRLHSLIFAACQGVPFAGISYDPKIDAFLQLYDCRPLSGSFTEMIKEITQLLNNSLISEDIKHRTGEMQQKSAENAHLALELIKPK